jgi:endonuclease YncB( thermonuclease family)
MPSPSYTAIVVRVMDGDTVIFDVPLWYDPELTLRQHFRLFGINAPEIHSTNPDEKKAGLAAMGFLGTVLPVGYEVKVTSQGHDKYGRGLVSVTLPDGSDVSKLMIESGHGLAWDGHGPKPI